MKNWKLVFEDDFNGTELNREVWVKEIGMVRNGEPQYYTDEDRNCYLKDGCLVIETLREDYEGAKFTSAAIETRDEYTWTYGRFEMKAKLPRSHVLWPAFWTLGKSIRHGVNWPRCGEIDIMEMTGGVLEVSRLNLPINLKISLISALTSFGGFSIMGQCMSMLPKGIFSFKKL